MPTTDREIVNRLLEQLNKEISPSKKQELIEAINKEQKLVNSFTDDNCQRHHYYILSDLYKQLYEVSAHTCTYTIEKLINNDYREFNAHRYDEYGFTDLAYQDEDLKLFFVIVDMHS